MMIRSETKNEVRPRELFKKKVPQLLKEKGHLWGRKNEICKFRITGTGGGTWVIDFSREVPQVREADEDAHCVITMSTEELTEIAEGRLDPQLAFLEGRLKVAGYLDLALKMSKLIRGA